MCVHVPDGDFNAKAQGIANALSARQTGTAAAIYDLAKSIGARTAQPEIGMQATNLDEAVALVLEHVLTDGPRPLDEAGIRGILTNAYAGRRPVSDRAACV